MFDTEYLTEPQDIPNKFSQLFESVFTVSSHPNENWGNFYENPYNRELIQARKKT